MGKTTSRSVRMIREDGVLHLRLSRTERYNAFDLSTLHALHEALLTPRHEVLVIAGEGPVFSVGPDIAELVTFDASAAEAYSRLAHQVIEALERWPGVTVALLSGYALGSGLELALGCDVLVGTPGLRLGLPGLAWALVPCMGGLRRLACRVAADVSSELFLKGEVLKAPQALSLGLIDRIADHPEDVDQLCRDLGEYSPSAVTAIRDLRLSRQGDIDADGEAWLFAQPFASGECQRRLRGLLSG